MTIDSKETLSEETLDAMMGKEKPVKWLIEGMLPEGHKGMVASPESGCKTTLLSWVAICVALGERVFGMPTKKGNVIMIDEETPEDSLNRKLDRFALGYGLKGRRDIPNIFVRSKTEYRFSHKNAELLEFVEKHEPALITIDTVLACLPAGRQGLEENNSNTGIAMRDDLDKILAASPSSSILLAAHSAKSISYYEVEDYMRAEMRDLVRGHGSITGEACDTGYGLTKISERPLRFVLIPKARREAIPMNITYVEMKEEGYGQGYARLEAIAPVPTPPSDAAVDIFSMFNTPDQLEDDLKASTIKQQASGLYTLAEIRLALEQLRRRRVIVTTANNFRFKLNPNVGKEVDRQYLEQLTRPKR